MGDGGKTFSSLPQKNFASSSHFNSGKKPGLSIEKESIQFSFKLEIIFHTSLLFLQTKKL